jgi:hypothetical protein
MGNTVTTSSGWWRRKSRPLSHSGLILLFLFTPVFMVARSRALWVNLIGSSQLAENNVIARQQQRWIIFR